MKPALQQITRPVGQSFIYFQRSEQTFAFNWHKHPQIELTAIVQGTGTRMIGDSITPYAPGSLVLVGGNLPHSWASDVLSKQNSAMVIQFDSSLFMQLPEAGSINQLLAKTHRGLEFPPELSQKIIEELVAMNNLNPLQRYIRLLEVLDQLARCRKCTALSSSVYVPPKRETDESRITKICIHLNQHFTAPLTLPDIAKRFHMSPASFSRYFKQTTGHTFVEYLIELRIAHAVNLLVETDLPVTEICFQSGFNNLSNFNRRFLRLKGISPATFRRSYRETLTT